MAIQFARLEYVSRSAGKNACCKGAYNSRSKVVDQQTNVTYNFHRIKDNVHHEILLPDNVNSKFKNLETLMNTIEKTERRKNSQLLKEYVIALPDNAELNLEDRIELVHRFLTAKKFVAERLGVQIDIHKPHEDEKNWHAHILVTTRRFSEDGLSLSGKARDLDATVKGGRINTYLERDQHSIGLLWKNIQNEFFEEKGLDLQVDEISIKPEVHLGPVRMRGFMNEAAQFHEDRKQAKKESLKTGDALLDHVTYYQAIFDKKDLEKAALGATTIENSAKILKEALASDRLLPLHTEDGKEISCWTTKEIRAEEERTLRVAERVYAHNTGDLNYTETKRLLQTMVDQNEVSSHQAKALTALLITNGLQGVSVLQGRAGTGKSHVLGKLNTLVASRYNVIGLAPTNKTAVGLNNVGYKNTDTIKGFLFKYKNNRISIPKNTLLVVDEAGMIGTETFLELLKVSYTESICVIFAGCDRQLTSVERAGIFAILAEKYGSAELTEIRRQEIPWGREVAKAFGERNIRAGVHILEQQKRLWFGITAEDAMSRLLADWSQSPELLENRLIISVANKNVTALNLGIREILKQQGILHGPEFKIESACTNGIFSAGDRILFADTNQKIGVNNGEFGTIIEAALKKFVVKTDSDKTLEFSPDEIKFKHGYAATIFKSQGDSIKDVFVYHSGFSNLRNSYVKMSRHINDLHLYCNTRATRTIQDLITQLGRSDNTDASLWYKTSKDLEASHKEQDHSIMQKIGGLVKEKAIFLGDVLHSNEDYYIFEKDEITTIKVEEVLTETNQQYQKSVGINDNFVYKTKNSVNVKTQEPLDPETRNSNVIYLENRLQKESTLKENNNAPKERWHDSVARTRNELKFAAERIALALLGEPNGKLSSKKTLRFGEHGKLAIEIQGPKAGIWYDFAADRGGDLLSLIQQELNLDFKEALTEAQKLMGDKVVTNINVIAEKSLTKQVNEIGEQEKVERLKNLHKSSQEISGIASKYLQNARGINSNVNSNEIRMVDALWHSNAREKMPAIVGFAKDHEGKITGAQVIYLDKKTGNKTEHAPAKKSLGKIAGSYVEIQAANIGVTLLAEGLETTLSLKEADLPGKILCTLGVNNFKHYAASKGENIIICADNDGKNAITSQTVNQAAEILQGKGASVTIVRPNKLGDYNDVLKSKGPSAIREQIMPHVEKHLDKTWLRVWEEKSTYKIAANTMLQDKNPHNALCIYNQAVQNTNKEINTFMKDNRAELKLIKKFAPKHNFQNFKESLKGLSKQQMNDTLQNTKFSTFKNYTIGKMTSIQKEKLATKNIDELIKVFEKEKSFCLGIDKQHGDLLTELKHNGYDKISRENTRHELKPTLIVDFTRDAANAIAWKTNSGKTESLFEQAKELSLYTVQRRLFDVCKEHVVTKVEHDLNSLKKYGHVKINDITYKTEKDYLQNTLADKALSPYLTGSKFEKNFETIKQIELLEQQRSSDRGDSR